MLFLEAMSETQQSNVESTVLSSPVEGTKDYCQVGFYNLTGNVKVNSKPLK